MARKSKVLEELKNITMATEEIEDIETLEPDVLFIQNINDKVMMIADERINGYVLHTVESIILLVIFAIIAKCDKFTEIYIFGCAHFDWLNKYIKFDNGMPSLCTIKRVISFINPKELENILVEAVKTFNEDNKPIYKIGMFEIEDIKTTDGKTANSSSRQSSKNGEIAKMNAMSVVSVKTGICEATEFIENKTNEIPTCPELLKRINIKNNIVVFDALNTQKEVIEYIFDNDAYYVAPVKGNHKILYEELCDYFNDEEFFNKVKNENYVHTIEKRNGSAEIREYGFTNDIDWIYKKSEWKGLKSVGFAKRTYRNFKGVITSDIRFYISNLDANFINIISTAIRSEWVIENNLHYFLDMVFKEDANTSFVKNTQKNLNIIRKFALALLKNYKEKTKLSMNSIRFLINTNFEQEISKILSL